MNGISIRVGNTKFNAYFFFYYLFKYSNGSYLNKCKISKINDRVQSICSSYLLVDYFHIKYEMETS